MINAKFGIMNKLIFCAFASVFIAVVQGFILDDLFGHGAAGRCRSDADCRDGCCAVVKGSLFDHAVCQHYILPGAGCDASASGMGCGCSPGYQCDAHLPSSIAVEPNSHLKGSCRPVSGSMSGPQIAVEGGR